MYFLKGIAVLFALIISEIDVHAQVRVSGLSALGGGVDRGAAPRFGVEYVLPEMHKWYAPRHLFETYSDPWYVRDTGYAEGDYRRYVAQLLEGSEWYDSFGTSLGRGWLVYSWNQIQSASQGSVIMKRPASPERRNTYSGFFSRLVIASDGDGRGTYRLMIGDQIYTNFTPLTFYKPRFNGLRMDYATDRLLATVLLSRPSEPNRDARTDVTNLMGGHLDFDMTEKLRFGLTFMNAHNARTKEEFASGNPFAGVLTTAQNQPLQDLWVSIRDDSPADDGEGPALFSYDIVLTDTSGSVIRGSEIGFLPFVEGGRSEGSTLVASGAERIVLHYDMQSLDYEGLTSIDMQRARVELSLANDYRVEMASNLQTDGDRNDPEPVFLTFDRAEDNVTDRSNGTVLRLDYALPTANELIGFNWDLRDWMGLSFMGEWVLNQRHGQYPSPNVPRGYRSVHRSTAAYGIALYKFYPWSLYVEGFSVDDAYATRYWLTEASGNIRYKDRVPQLYEFVDDDDDFDAVPDWERPLQPWNATVWPGYDENGDFIYDHNQNVNLQPDYEEPFLRFRSDRPEFFFGLDMNHNGVVDRFEDDDLPDYPFERDLRGFNSYLSANIGPDVKWLVGRQHMRRLSGDGHTRSWYTLLAGTWRTSWGRLRLFEHAKLVRDDIPNDINQWVQPAGALGRMRRVFDSLPMRNTWQHALYLDLDHELWEGTHFLHRFKWDALWQRDDKEAVREREGRYRSRFIGLINKGEWSIPIGLAVFEPRVKSEIRSDRPFNALLEEVVLAEQTLFLLWTQPLMAESVGVAYFPRYGRQMFNTQLQVGLELSRLSLLEGQSETVREGSKSWTLVSQLTNRVGYLGYQLVLRAGLRLGNRHLDGGDDERSSLFFLTVNAGL